MGLNGIDVAIDVKRKLSLYVMLQPYNSLVFFLPDGLSNELELARRNSTAHRL